MWNAVTGEELHSFQHNHIVKSVAFDTNSQCLVTGNNEKLIRVYDLNKPDESPDIFRGHAGSIKRALFCRNDKYIVSCADDKSVRVWDRASGSEVQHVDFTSNPNSLEISRDGNVLTVTSGSNVTFYEMETLKKLKEITVPTRLSAASLHPDKLIFVCGGEDFKMYKYDYITGNEIGETTRFVIIRIDLVGRD